jgi:exosortase/archaeosortase family protein
LNVPWSRLCALLAVFIGLQWAYGSLAGGRIERFVIEQATVRSAVFVIRRLDPAAQASADGARIVAPGGGLHVREGCEGTDVALLLVSALLVAPLGWRWKCLGIAAGVVLVFVLNQARVLALFYAFRHYRHGFDLLHGTLLPLSMVLAAAGFFLLWVHKPKLAATP